MDGRAGSGWQGTSWESGALNPARGRMQNLSWLVTDFAERVPDVDHALVVSSDGVPMAVSEGVAPDHAEQLSAITSGLVSLASGVARVFDGGAVTQTQVAMGQGTLVIMSIRDGSSLATLARAEADLDLVAYEMSRLTEAVGGVLTPPTR